MDLCDRGWALMKTWIDLLVLHCGCNPVLHYVSKSAFSDTEGLREGKGSLDLQHAH